MNAKENSSQPETPNSPTADVTAGEGGKEAKNPEVQAKAEDGTLAFLKQTLGRDFKDIADAEKTIKSLNSMVGDRAISELRRDAKLGGEFKKVVEGYAKENGMSFDDAQAELLSMADEKVESTPSDADSRKVDEALSNVTKEISSLKERQERDDLIRKHPESEHVMSELVTIAKATGKSLSEAYESSETIKVAARTIAESRDRNSKGSVMSPSGQLSEGKNKVVSDAVDALKANRTRANEIKLVEIVLGTK